MSTVLQIQSGIAVSSAAYLNKPGGIAVEVPSWAALGWRLEFSSTSGTGPWGAFQVPGQMFVGVFSGGGGGLASWRRCRRPTGA